MFIQMMRNWAEFSGLSVITHCLMDNHFHVMLWVPRKISLDHAGLLVRLAGVWPEEKVASWEAFYQKQDSPMKRSMDAALLERMANLPEFMRILKQSFTCWYNRKHQRKGTLWDSRYRSVVVEGSPLALMSVAAYIDLNPLRARMVEDPMRYVWSGYGSAMGGDKQARLGLEALVRLSRGHLPDAALMVRQKQLAEAVDDWREIGPMLSKEHAQRAAPKDWNEVQAAYRLWLANKGVSQAEFVQIKKQFRKRKGMDPVQVLAEYESLGVIPASDALHCRMRSFTRGVALGAPAFLEMVMGQFRSCFGPNRQSAPRRVKGIGSEWMSLRQVDGNKPQNIPD